jgi:uncharacterized SAM-binding protein YcdF (DUF218 family)
MGSSARRPWGQRRTTRALAVVAGLTLVWMAARAGPALVIRVPIANPDTIISLASHEWERLPTTASLATQYPGAVVLLTQPAEVTEFNCHDCGNRVHRLALLGVHDERVRQVTLTTPGTHGEAVAALDYSRAAGVHRLMIVTSPYHARRSLGVFRKVFANTNVEIGVEPALADSVARPERWWWGGYDRAYVAYEWAAVVYYAWEYGVAPWVPGSESPRS